MQRAVAGEAPGPPERAMGWGLGVEPGALRVPSLARPRHRPRAQGAGNGPSSAWGVHLTSHGRPICRVVRDAIVLTPCVPCEPYDGHPNPNPSPQISPLPLPPDPPPHPPTPSPDVRSSPEIFRAILWGKVLFGLWSQHLLRKFSSGPFCQRRG